MRKYAIAGVVVLLLIGFGFSVWLLLQPKDRPAHPAIVADDTVAPPVNEGKALESPINQPEPVRPVSTEPSTPVLEAEPAPKPSAVETPAPMARGIEITGRVEDAITGKPLQATVSLAYDDDQVEEGVDCTPEGTFRFHLPLATAIPEDAILRAWCDGYSPSQVPAAATNVVRMTREVITVVNVRIEGSACTPESAWLVWEGDAADRQEGEKFEQGVARIELDMGRDAGDCRVFCHWFGQLIQSELLTVVAGETYDVTLNVPAGAELLVTVIGPDGVAMPGAKVEVSEGYAKQMVAYTGEAGDVLFTGVSAPGTWMVELKQVKGAQCLAEVQPAEFTTASDRREVRFDLTATGTVDCKLTVNGSRLARIDVTAADTPGQRTHYLWMETGEKEQWLIYGLKPGRYKVEASDWQSDSTYSAEFEVLALPAISMWHKDFQTHRVTVHVTGAGTADLRLSYTAGGYAEVFEIGPQPTGEFILSSLGDGNYELRVHGGGWASEVVSVNPATQPEVTIEVVAAGTLKLKPRAEPAYRLVITGIEPARKAVTAQGRQDGSADTVVLPPGRYKVSEDWMGGLWDPFEVTVTAGETTEHEYGPEYISTLQMRSRDRKRLWDYEITIEKDGVPLKITQTQTWSGGDEYFSANFEAEGKLTLRITGDGIEDFTREFEVNRGETASLEVELKLKE